MRVVLASENAHKATEFATLLPGLELELLGPVSYPEETGTTYYANALGKARFGRTLAPTEAWVLGDDSGIEVEALDWGPGIGTARWSGGDGVGKLLAALGDGESRRARYVCELVAIGPDGVELRGSGTLEGTIAREPGGTAGFGFDPIFVPDGEERTVAELGEAWKDESSHRARAARELLTLLAAAPS